MEVEFGGDVYEEEVEVEDGHSDSESDDSFEESRHML